MLEQHLPAELLRHCTVGAVRSGTVTIHVDSPGRLYLMRVQWYLPLLELIHRQLTATGITDIAFKLQAGPLQHPNSVPAGSQRTDSAQPHLRAPQV